MKEGHWRMASRIAILEAIAEAERLGLEGRHRLRYVRRHGYPFGPRENYPYKVWLSEMRWLLNGGRLPGRGRGPRRPADGQQELSLTTEDP